MMFESAAGLAVSQVEVSEIDVTAFRLSSIAAESPLPSRASATITLADGRSVQGFLCEAYATRGAEDITAFGGWRAWHAARP